MVSTSYLTSALAIGIFLGQVACQPLLGTIKLYPSNNMCDDSDGHLECTNAPAGLCCFVRNSFILSTNTQLTSAPGPGDVTHQLFAAQGLPPNQNFCAVLLNQDRACAKTSQSGTAQAGSYRFTPHQRLARLARTEGFPDQEENTADKNCLQPDVFKITDGNTVYSAPMNDTTIAHVLSLGRAEKIEWAKQNGKAPAAGA